MANNIMFRLFCIACVMTTCYSQVCTPIKYDPRSKPKQLAECYKEKVHWESTAFGHNECYPDGGIIQDYSCVSDGVTDIQSCSLEVKCPQNKFLNSTGHCVKSFVECYYNAGDLVPKNILLPAGNCGPEDWKSVLPGFCSIGVTKDGCEEVGRSALISYVTRDDGSRVFVNKLSVELSQIGTREEAFFMDRRLDISSGVYGDEVYCKKVDGSAKSCYKNSSSDQRQYRIFRRDSEVPYLHLNTCKTPIRGYGAISAIVFDKKRPTINTVCGSCKVVCLNDKVTLSMPTVGDKIIRICGRSGCNMRETTSSVTELERNFLSKTSDEIIRTTISDISKSYIFSFETKCPVLDTCSAIDCHFCYIRLVNVTCYAWYHYLIALIVLHISLVLLSMIMSLLIPALNVTWGLCKVFGKLIFKVSRLMMGKGRSSVSKVRKYAEADDYVSVPMNDIPIRGYRGGIGPIYGTALFLAMITICSSRAPCSTSVVDNISSDMCIKKSGLLECRSTSVSIVPLISYDQTSCMHFMGPNGDIIGELQVTPIELHFKCSKVSEFWTRDVEFVSDHIVHCPHAADCTVEWCPTVDRTTEVQGFAKVVGPLEQFCKLGEACWGEGCFYCSNSCHTVRYYTRPRSSDVFEVFSCSKWEPSGTFHVEWITSGGSGTSTISLFHGQTVEVISGVSVTLDFTVQNKYPILSKHFMTNGDKTVLIENSSRGQPIPGTVGALQCPNKKSASSLEDCVMAPNTCICSPTGGSDSCDCSQINLSGLMSGQQVLPTQVGEDYLEITRDSVSLKTAAFGSAKMSIRSNQPMKASTETAPDCVIEMEKYTGCHSCISGAKAKYVCTSLRPSAVVVQCDTGLSLILSCDDSRTSKVIRASFSTPIVSGICKAPCSKKSLHISGLLESMGYIALSNASHIQLSPEESHLGWGNWLKGVWFSMGWFNVLWISLGLILVIFVLSLMHKILKVGSKVKIW
ncbi:glycoprotein precursor [Gouleako virus]|uniref:Glycoprotein n=8 Tax=Gouleako virus TaxID=603003 RepID=G0Y278_9VIRU|nr:glycoprotein precursor [Gouleako virus]AEJ38174.1 glycoprotein precursor [Gouleako virus]